MSGFARAFRVSGLRRQIETRAFAAQTPLHDLVQPDERPSADEQDFLRVHLDVFLVRMLAPALRRHVAGTAFENLQERLLHALAGHVARDADVVRLAPDLVDLVDVNDADLGALHVVIRVLEQAQDDVFHVLADVAGLGQRRGVGDAEGHVENLRQRAGQERLARTGGADEQDVALFDLHVRQRVHRQGTAPVRPAALLGDALVVVMNRHREHLLGHVLADHVPVQLRADFLRLGHADDRRLPPRVVVQLLVEDVLADVDATVADVDAGTGDELAHLGVAFATEGTHREVGSASHGYGESGQM